MGDSNRHPLPTLGAIYYRPRVKTGYASLSYPYPSPSCNLL